MAVNSTAHRPLNYNLQCGTFSCGHCGALVGAKQQYTEVDGQNFWRHFNDDHKELPKAKRGDRAGFVDAVMACYNQHQQSESPVDGEAAQVLFDDIVKARHPLFQPIEGL